MDNFDKNIEEYNPNKKQKLTVKIDYMIADTFSNKTVIQ